MATNQEFFALRNNQALLERLSMSIAKACNTVFTENVATSNHAARLTWARNAIRNPYAEAEQAIWILFAANASSTVAQIQAVSDSTMDSAVAGIINQLANIAT